MFNKDIKETIGQIKNPDRKLNLLFLLSAIFALTTVITILYKSSSSKQEEQVIYLNQRILDQRQNFKNRKSEDSVKIIRLEYEKDSLIKEILNITILRYNDKNETVTELKQYLKK